MIIWRRPLRHKLALHAALCNQLKVLGHGFFPYTGLAITREWYFNIGWPFLCTAQFAVIFNSMWCDFTTWMLCSAPWRFFLSCVLMFLNSLPKLKTWIESPSLVYCKEPLDLMLYSVYWPIIKFCEVSSIWEWFSRNFTPWKQYNK